MRRKDREITDRIKISEIIKACHCCRLGFNDGGNVYIVPLNFGYEKDGENYTFYFHSAPEGRKIDLIKTGCSVGFEMDVNYSLNEATDACGYSAKFQSIIGSGKVSLIYDKSQKIHALQSIMHHYTGKSDWNFPDSVLENTAAFKLEVCELSCKEHE